MHSIFMAQNAQDVGGLGNGYLYNPYAAFDANFAPTDYRVALVADFQDLDTVISISGEGLKEDGLIHWDSPNTNGSPPSGFNAFGSGRRLANGTFESIKTDVYFWAYLDGIDDKFYRLINTSASLLTSAAVGNLGLSVKMVYTGGGTPTTVTDNDGNIYDVVLIGGLRWTAQHWKCTTLDNGDPIPTETDNTNWANATTLKKCAYGNDVGNV